MNTILRTFALLTLLTAPTIMSLKAADLGEGDKQFLATYEQVRAALAADDLAKAKAAAGQLGLDGAGIAMADKIAPARTEFAKLSERAISLARG